MQIIVLGAHRSGTSVLTRLLNMMGAYAGSEGSTIGFNPENPKGFWERRDVINANDAILHHLDCRWDDLSQWSFTTPDTYRSEALTPELHETIKSIVLEMDHHRPWVMKDPRLCETFGFWRQHLEVPVAVIGWRDPLEVAISLHTRNGLPLLHGLALWEHAMRCALLCTQDLPRISVRYADLMEQPLATASRLYQWTQQIGLQAIRQPSEAEINAFIDPALYRSKATDASYQVLLTAPQQQLVDQLLRGALDEVSPSLCPIAADTLRHAHQHRLTQDRLAASEAFSEKQAERIRDLEQVVELYEDQPIWSLKQDEWEQLKQQLGAQQTALADLRSQLEHRIDLLGDPGRIRRRLARLLAAIA